jgi:hypothetical protein
MMNPTQKINRVATVTILIGIFLIFGALAQVIVWSLDRSPPFVMVSYTSKPTKAGDVVIFRATVKREMHRHCSVTYSRMFYDSSGSRYDITEGAQIMNSIALDDQNRRTPDSLILSVKVPSAATPGVGVLITVLDYECNPVHKLYPIPVLLTMDVEVL